jgi:hypothetical protein
MKNYWLDRVERRKKEQLKRFQINKIANSVNKIIKKIKAKDGN